MALLTDRRSLIQSLLCLQYYMAKSDGWRDIGNCDECVEENVDALLPLTDCSLQDGCQCNICVRQPPSLFNLAIHVLMNYTVSLRLFSFNAETTYDQYDYAYRSDQVTILQLLPPEYPSSASGSDVDMNHPIGFIGIVPVLRMDGILPRERCTTRLM